MFATPRQYPKITHYVFDISLTFCILCSFLCSVGIYYADNLYLLLCMCAASTDEDRLRIISLARKMPCKIHY